jgi:hypothetical protein
VEFVIVVLVVVVIGNIGNVVVMVGKQMIELLCIEWGKCYIIATYNFIIYDTLSHYCIQAQFVIIVIFVVIVVVIISNIGSDIVTV